MADHVRRQIREALKAVLGGLPTTGARVYTGRAFALNGPEIPGLIITTADGEGERSDVDSIGAVKLTRTVLVNVLGYAAGVDVEDRLDQVALEVEAAIAADWEDSSSGRLRALARNCVLKATQLMIEPAEKRIGQIRLSYEIEYRTPRGAPQTAV